MKPATIAPIAAALVAAAVWAQGPRGQAPQNPQQQNPQQRAEPEPPRTASISGAVVAAATGEPIAGATVEIRRADCSNFSNPPDVTTARTDSKGNFSFQKLREGGWCVVASAPGGAYMPAEYMQHGYKERGATLPVLEGQSVTDIRLALASTGGISGRILDRDAEAMPHARVQLLEAYYEDGRRKLYILQSVPHRSAVTRDCNLRPVLLTQRRTGPGDQRTHNSKRHQNVRQSRTTSESFCLTRQTHGPPRNTGLSRRARSSGRQAPVPDQRWDSPTHTSR
jgi:hypothetical protein